MTERTVSPDSQTRDNREALLRKLVAQRVAAARKQGIAPRAQTGPAPLSFGQELMWVLDQLDPGSTTYNSPIVRRIKGELNLDALRRAVNALVERHEVLRTTFATLDGAPVQQINDISEIELPQHDLRALPAADRERAGLRLVIEEIRRPFDLAKDVMIRPLLVRIADDEHFLLFNFHHIATDGWSKEVLNRELATLYTAYSQGRPSPLPPPSLQYADFACWQRQWLQGEKLDKLLVFWKERLAGAAALLELPGDRPRPAVQTNHGTHRRFQVSKATTEGIKALSQREGVTAYMTLMAAYMTLIHRYTGRDDVLVGSPIAARNRHELEGLVGYFSNTLVLRTDLSGRPTFRELLQRVRETTLAAYDHQDLPFEKLVVELRPERNLSYTPMVQLAFILLNRALGEALELPGISLTPVEINRGTAKFDLTVGFLELPEGYRGSVEYNTDLFDEATIIRFQDHFRNLLGAIVADPNRRIDDLPLLSSDERSLLLFDWNRTTTEPEHNSKTPAPEHTCVHTLIEAQVERTPDGVAVVFGDRQWTYRELDERANQLAHYLRKLGVGPEVCVGISVEGGLAAAVGLLGVLKAGGAFVPLDPAYPKERLAYMLQDSGVGIVLTLQHLTEMLPPHAAKVICLDADWPVIATEPTHSPAAPVQLDNCAYVIYTSGSTGQPKGVQVTHRGLVNHNVAVAKQFALTPADRVLQFSSLSFDIAIEEMFPSWLSGAAVVFRPADLLLVAEELQRWIGEQRITVVDLPTSFWHVWVQGMTAAQALPPALRLVVVGGEKASAAAHATWRQLTGDRVRWLNTYGPTETTVVATWHEPPAPEQGAVVQELPIGRPIPNLRVYVLDRRLHPAPIGVPGELYVGGVGVARGYLRRPGLTAERFIPDPFSGAPGARLYKTGDLVRFRANGELEFLGRTDQQIKLRGFRVEPGEIESMLRQHPAVQDAIVILTEGDGDDKKLAAYVVARGEQPRPADVRGFLQRRLPPYMVPATVVVLDAFPLTRNGKIDRRALPKPESAAVDAPADATGGPPRTPLEEAVAEVWAAVLGVPQVGIDEDFFDLGGHSLMATRVVVRLRERLGVELGLRDLFENATVAKLSLLLLQRLMEEAPSDRLAV